MIRSLKALSIFCAILLIPCLAPAQTPASDKAASDKAAAYYNFAMGHLNAELAGAMGNRSEYVNKAIDFYRQALKLDPNAPYIFEELTDLYIQTGHLKDAVTEAQDMLKRNPDNLEARRILGRIYYRMIGDPQQGKINEEMLKQAIAQYKEITARDAKDVESWVILGRLYRVSSDTVDAEKAYKQALAIDPSNEQALSDLALVYADIGDTKKAIEMLTQVTERDPRPGTLGTLAEFYEQTRDYKAATAVLRKALELNPDSGRLKRQLAQDLILSDQLDEALKIYNALIADDPKEAPLQLRVSEIYRQKHDFDKARAALEKAKQIDSESLDVRYEEVNLLSDEGKTQEAIASLKGILDQMAKKSYTDSEKQNRVMLLDNLGRLYRTANKYQEAVDTFHQISEIDPDNGAKASVMIVETWRSAKDYKKAKVEADAAVKKYPDQPVVKQEHASLLADMGKIDEGVAEVRSLHTGDRVKDRELEIAVAQLYEKGKRWAEEEKAFEAADKLSETPKEKQDLHFMRGAMYEKMKKYGEAEAEFRKVLESEPNNASALNYLGYMFAEAGIKLDEAAKLVGKALEIDPGNGAYLDSLGWVYYRQNRLPEAENLLVQALEKIGKDPTVHDHLGDIYFKQGKTKDAIMQWQASIQEYEAGLAQDMEASDAAKINKKLESARVRLAKEGGAPNDKR